MQLQKKGENKCFVSFKIQEKADKEKFIVYTFVSKNFNKHLKLAKLN